MSARDPVLAQYDGHIALAERLPSPFYATLLRHMRADAEEYGPMRTALAGHEHDDVQQWDIYRLLAGVHQIVLSGGAPDLEAHYPSTGGDGDADAAWPAVRDLIAWGRAEIVEALSHPLQTNAPTRAKALVGPLCVVAKETGRPLRLLELGSSAGLNLRIDRYRYELGEMTFGPPDSPVRFTDFVGNDPSTPLPLDGGFEIAERAGCDLHPLDPTDDADRLTLLSCIFPDERERFDLLERAIAVAHQTPATVEEADIADWVAKRLAQPTPGLATVLMHTVVWPYLPEAVRGRAEASISAAGERATDEAPLALLSFEAGEDSSAPDTRLTVWPGGEERLMARSSFHPTTIEWLG